MSTNLLFGQGKRIEWNGKTYEVKPYTLAQYAELSANLEAELWASHNRSKKFLSQDDWDRKGALLDRDIALQKYTYPGSAFFSYFGTKAGLKAALYICFRDSKQDIDEDDLEKLVETAYEDALRAIVESNQNPSIGETEPAVTPSQS